MAKLNYTSRDYAAVLAELQAKAREVFPDWTDFNEANGGNAILGAVALAADILNANQDAQYNECYWDSARQRKAIISMAKLNGYRLASAKPAVVEIQATVPATAGGVTIPTGTKITSVGLQPVRIFELQSDLTIPAGQTSGMAIAKHAETQEDNFIADGTSDQEYILSFGPYLDGSAVVTVEGTEWTYVDNFVGSTSTDRHFTTETDENDIATIVFSDGVLGARPSGFITVTYTIGGGLIGNVPANTMKVLDRAFTDVIGAGVQVQVTNPQPANGGEERESIERARKVAPIQAKDTGFTVSREDYETNSLIAGVVRAKAVSQADLPSLAVNQTGVYIIPTAGGAPSQALRDAVRQELLVAKPIQLGWDVVPLPPMYRTIDVNVAIIAQPGVDRAQLQQDAEKALTQWFGPDRTNAIEDEPWNETATWTGAGAYALSWGMTVYLGRLLALMFRDPQTRVFNASFVAPAGDVVCGALEFPVLGNLTVVVN